MEAEDWGGWRGSRVSRKAALCTLLCLGVMAGLMLQIACGGGGSSGSSGGGGTPAGTYTVTVKGASGSTRHNTSVTLTVP